MMREISSGKVSCGTLRVPPMTTVGDDQVWPEPADGRQTLTPLSPLAVAKAKAVFETRDTADLAVAPRKSTTLLHRPNREWPSGEKGRSLSDHSGCSAKAEKRQDGDDDHNQTDNIDNIVHGACFPVQH